MKVECIYEAHGSSVTLGEVYDVISQNEHTYWLKGVPHAINKECFNIVTDSSQKKPIDAHYAGFVYKLSMQDIDNGEIKIDPYFVAKQWQLGTKDDSGVLFHCLKNISRFGDKNSKEREIVALYKQIKRLAQLEGVNLEP